MSISRIVLCLSEVGASKAESYDIPAPASGVSYDWIVQSIKDIVGLHSQILELKYEDDESDLITFSSQHEVLEAITVAEAASQAEFRIYASYVKNLSTSPVRNAEAAKAEASSGESEEKKGDSSPIDVRALLADFVAYVNSLSSSARESISDAIQVGVQELKENIHPKQAFEDVIALLPTSEDLTKLLANVKRVSAEQWESIRAFISRIPKETWAFIESNIPNWMNFVNMLPRFAGAEASAPTGATSAAPGGANPFGGMGAGGNPFGNMASMLGLMSMFGGAGAARTPEQKVDIPSVDGVKIEVEPLSNEIPLAEPGMHVVRTWKIKNVGNKTLPEGVQLRPIEDPFKLASDSIGAVLVPSINPGESTEISQLLQAPDTEGHYNIVFGLKSFYGEGPSIGPDMPVELLVTEAF